LDVLISLFEKLRKLAGIIGRGRHRRKRTDMVSTNLQPFDNKAIWQLRDEHAVSSADGLLQQALFACPASPVCVLITVESGKIAA